jgi:hypothetical protein
MMRQINKSKFRRFTAKTTNRCLLMMMQFHTNSTLMLHAASREETEIQIQEPPVMHKMLFRIETAC